MVFYTCIFSIYILLFVFCSLPGVLRKRENVKQHVTEEMLDVVVDICLTETDTVSLQDIPNTFVSVDADDAEAIK